MCLNQTAKHAKEQETATAKAKDAPNAVIKMPLLVSIAEIK
jgi:hypothetical protein